MMCQLLKLLLAQFFRSSETLGTLLSNLTLKCPVVRPKIETVLLN